MFVCLFWYCTSYSTQSTRYDQLSRATGQRYRNPLQKSELQQPVDSSLQGSEINKVIITEENSFTHSNRTGKLGKTVIIVHSAFVFGVFLPIIEGRLKLFQQYVTQYTRGSLNQHLHTSKYIYSRQQKTWTNFHQYHIPCSDHLCLSCAQPRLPPGRPVLFTHCSSAFAVLCSLFPNKPCFALGNLYYSMTPKSGLGFFYSCNDWLTENSIIEIH